MADRHSSEVKDVNGVTIYEGDILEYDGMLKPVTVTFERGMYQAHGYPVYWLVKKWHARVIGNKKDNPELLEER